MTKRFLKKLSVAAVIFATASLANASGYEKSIMWGGRSAGVAGIATPYMQGSQALYFNPAGLVSEKPGQDVSFNISPTQLQFQGPINYANDNVSSEKATILPMGLMYGMTVNPNWGWGVGFYASGGAQANYPNVDFGGFSGLEEKTELKVYEIAGGAGFRVSDRLKLGAAYRIVMANGSFSTIGLPQTGVAVNTVVSNVKDTQYTGFKLGAQYKLDERSLLGLVYRSEVNFKADADIAGNVYVAGVPHAITPASGKVDTTLPMAIQLGYQHDFNDFWRMLVQYDWTQYSRVADILVEGQVVASPYVNASNPRIKQDWYDEHALRLAGEYMGTPWPIRFGFIYTTNVTNTAQARAAFVPPGPAYTLTAGSGKTFDVGGNPMQFDGALEYITASGDSTGGAAAGATSGSIRAGTYKVSSLGLHLGLGYAF